MKTDLDKIVPLTLLGEFLLKKMKENEMSIRQFGRYLGLERDTISRILETSVQPDLSVLIRISKALKMDLLLLVGLSRPEDIDAIARHYPLAQNDADNLRSLQNVSADVINTIVNLASNRE